MGNTDAIGPLLSLKNECTLEDIQHIFSFLLEKGTFNFPALPNGLFSAAIVQNETAYTGYAHVWIRDNIYVAYAHAICGKPEVAERTVGKIATFLKTQTRRFESIIAGQTSPDQIMERPHIRFVGDPLQESPQQWQHAQNDALGYFLWLYCQLVIDGRLKPEPEDWALLSLFPPYFATVQYWQDEDSGHWEEDRKIEASSIGAVLAGLQRLQQLLAQTFERTLDRFNPELIAQLIAHGQSALDTILPAECIQPPPQGRRYDAALLFLIYPLQVVNWETARQILHDVTQHLQGDRGIRRYLGDSFWCRNYRVLPKDIRTTISGDREAWLADRGEPLQPGEEAQWCIFDPIVSIAFGLGYQQTREQYYLAQQIRYFNRALSQITAAENDPSYKCPELYYLQDGVYIPNDSTPLLWTQANLWMAFKVMEQSL